MASTTDGPGEIASAGTYRDSGVGVSDRLERLWAPYRMTYITDRPAQNQDGSDGALSDPFVEAPKHSDEESLIVARGETVYCLLNLFPYNVGHMMVVPYRQVGDLEALTETESRELMEFVQHAVRTLKHVSRPQGINVGFNLGQSSGGSVRDHLHLHVVPRWAGDANFMTVLSGTKVLPQLLSETRALMAQGWSDVSRDHASQEDERA